MYWTDWGTDKIQRADLDGFNVEDLVTSGEMESPQGIVLDVAGGKMYWTGGDKKIKRANLDGSDVQDLVTAGLESPQGIALDIGGEKVYWIDWGTGIQRADLDGSNVEEIVTLETGYPQGMGIALDVGEGRVYWTAWSHPAIRQADLNGSNAENLLTTVGRPLFLALDAVGGKMYWSVFDQVGFGTDASAIYRADLDGSNVETVVGAKAGSREFILDVDGGKIYWQRLDIHPTYEGATDFILRADLEGSNVEEVVAALSAERVHPGPLDIGGDKMYWVGGGTIYRTELDGTNTVALVTGVGPLWKFALDLAGGKMYWMEDNDPVGRESKHIRGAIRRADLDGSNVQDLQGGIRAPWHFDFDLDVVGGKIYWTDGDSGKWSDPDGSIQRSNLDGSDVEVLFTGRLSSSIALYTPQITTLNQTHITLSEREAALLGNLPVASGLDPNTPNPFNRTTKIPYRLATPGPMRLEIYNVLGQPVRALVDEVQTAGFYQVSWDARDQRGAVVATGVYLTRMIYPGGVETRGLLYLE